MNELLNITTINRNNGKNDDDNNNRQNQSNGRSNPKTSPKNQKALTINHFISTQHSRRRRKLQKEEWTGLKQTTTTTTTTTVVDDRTAKMKNQSILVKNNSRNPEKVTQSFNNTINNIQTQQQTFKIVGWLQNQNTMVKQIILLFYLVELKL